MSNIIIGENGNWFIDGVDTGRPSRGRDGRSAFEIATDLGYQGTMTEWANDLKGDSAYEVAVNSGFQGTEKEWLDTLKGEAGLTPHIGENGNWIIGDIDSGILANVEQKYSELLSQINEIMSLFPYKEFITVDIGAMPNNTTKNVNLPNKVKNLNDWHIIGCWAHTSYGLYPIPYCSQNYPANNVELYLYTNGNGTMQVKVKTYTDWTGYKGKIMLGKLSS